MARRVRAQVHDDLRPLPTLHSETAVLRAREISDAIEGDMPTVQQTKKTAMTTHMKAPSRTGAIALCGAPGATVTDTEESVDCEECKLIMRAAPYSYTAALTRAGKKNSHYDAGGIETIDVIRAKLTPEQFSGYCLGNAIKYTLRANFKGAFAADADKAADYTKWLSEHTRGR